MLYFLLASEILNLNLPNGSIALVLTFSYIIASEGIYNIFNEMHY